MKVYLFRHAQKSIDFSGDPDLTPQGVQQSESLARWVLDKKLPQPTQLFASPRVRAQNTFKPLSKSLNLAIEIDERLLEQQATENTSDFLSKIRSFIGSLTYQKNEVIFICSHYDVVADALNLLPADTDFSDDQYSQWAPCQFAGFEVLHDGLYKFIEFNRIPIL